MGAELDHMGRFLNMVVDYKHKIGFEGTILVEPKPQEPSKHQYDYDAATCFGFLQKYGLEGEVKLNLEQGHAILAGHSFEHEIATASALGVLGSIDMNRNDYQSGWDTDQFPNNVPEVALTYYHILKAGGLGTGGTNFDAKLRRQSLDPADLITAHVGAMDVCARGLKAAAAMIEDGALVVVAGDELLDLVRHVDVRLKGRREVERLQESDGGALLRDVALREHPAGRGGTALEVPRHLPPVLQFEAEELVGCRHVSVPSSGGLKARGPSSW